MILPKDKVNKTNRNGLGVHSSFSKSNHRKNVYSLRIQTSSGVNNCVMLTVMCIYGPTLKHQQQHKSTKYFNKCNNIREVAENDGTRIKKMGENHRVSCQTFIFIYFIAVGFQISANTRHIYKWWAEEFLQCEHQVLHKRLFNVVVQKDVARFSF